MEIRFRITLRESDEATTAEQAHARSQQQWRWRWQHTITTARGPNPLTRNYESNGPDVKIRGIGPAYRREISPPGPRRAELRRPGHGGELSPARRALQSHHRSRTGADADPERRSRIATISTMTCDDDGDDVRPIAAATTARPAAAARLAAPCQRWRRPAADHRRHAGRSGAERRGTPRRDGERDNRDNRDNRDAAAMTARELRVRRQRFASTRDPRSTRDRRVRTRDPTRRPPKQPPARQWRSGAISSNGAAPRGSQCRPAGKGADGASGRPHDPKVRSSAKQPSEEQPVATIARRRADRREFAADFALSESITDLQIGALTAKFRQ